MIKNKFVLAVFVLLLGVSPLTVSFAHAQAAAVPANGDCSPATANGPDQTCVTGYECNNDGICVPPPANNSVGANGWCGSNDAACQSGLTCDDTGTCTASPAAAPAASATTQPGGGFVPLTNLPIFSTDVTTATGFAAFFNALYKYCIGIAATLCVLQIMRAGLMYMGGDSVSEVSKARGLILSSLGGLVLVLSPVVVFGIINPRILNLNIGSDLSQLNLGATPAAGAPAAGVAAPTTGDNIYNTSPGVAPDCPNTIANGATVSSSNDQACCYRQSGCVVQVTIPKVGNALSKAYICSCS